MMQAFPILSPSKGRPTRSTFRFSAFLFAAVALASVQRLRETKLYRIIQADGEPRIA